MSSQAGLVAAVRRFNRFYTQKIGVLDEGLLESPYSLTEVRVLYELGRNEATTATAIAAELGLDGGYLSRILRRFAARRLVARARSETDGRQTVLRMTARGQALLAALEARSGAAVAELLAPLPASGQRRVVEAMGSIQAALGAPGGRRGGWTLRPHRPGDLGWVVERHGALYSDEYGFDQRFEAVVAGIVADFVKGLDPERERCWIADEDGARLGSIFLVKKSRTVAKLRLLLVEPQARGRGLGRALVDECLGFARQAGYRKVTLWTNSLLVAARRIYESSGFRLTGEKPEALFGPGSLGQTWDLVL